MYQSLREELHQKEKTLKDQESIHSEVEIVKQQLEENKVRYINIHIHMRLHIHQVLVNSTWLTR